MEYRSTISCSLMFSGISSLAGMFRNLALRVSGLNSIQEYLVALATLAWMTSRLLDLSLTATTSPGMTLVEGMWQTIPLRVMWAWLTSCLAAGRVGATPIR